MASNIDFLLPLGYFGVRWGTDGLINEGVFKSKDSSAVVFTIGGKSGYDYFLGTV